MFIYICFTNTSTHVRTHARTHTHTHTQTHSNVVSCCHFTEAFPAPALRAYRFLPSTKKKWAYQYKQKIQSLSVCMLILFSGLALTVAGKNMLGSLELLFRNLDSVLDAGVCNDLSEQVCQALLRDFQGSVRALLTMDAGVCHDLSEQT